jgi:hypothetical protein
MVRRSPIQRRGRNASRHSTLALIAMPAIAIAAAGHIPALSGNQLKVRDHGKLVRIDGAIARVRRLSPVSAVEVSYLSWNRNNNPYRASHLPAQPSSRHSA